MKKKLLFWGHGRKEIQKFCSNRKYSSFYVTISIYTLTCFCGRAERLFCSPPPGRIIKTTFYKASQLSTYFSYVVEAIFKQDPNLQGRTRPLKAKIPLTSILCIAGQAHRSFIASRPWRISRGSQEPFRKGRSVLWAKYGLDDWDRWPRGSRESLW